ncbi:MAG: cyclic nucleotide-binding domain-containing protein [Nitrospirae bacterium]|nr:cyclic nucleotide-binding domain-containing protein [Nitrospirota bacterium]
MIKPSVLRQQVLLEDIDEAGLQGIAGIIKKLSFKKGDCLFKEKEETKGLYLINSGKVEISKVTPNGWKQTLAILTKGHFLGELSILEKRRHEATAVAIENTEVFLIPKEYFEKMEKENLSLAFKIMKKLLIITSKNLRRMNEKFLNALISY